MSKSCCAICPECDGHMHPCCNERGCRWEHNLAREGEEPIIRTAPHGALREESYWYCLFCGTRAPMTEAQIKAIAAWRESIPEEMRKRGELPAVCP